MRRESATTQLVFFTDRDLGRAFPTILRQAGLSVECHADHFADDAPDEVWIAAVAAKGWTAVTHDKAISRRANEKSAVFRAGLGLIVVVGGAPHAELAQNFVATRSAIERFLGHHSPPFVARLYRPTPAELKRKRPRGRIELWMDRE